MGVMSRQGPTECRAPGKGARNTGASPQGTGEEGALVPGAEGSLGWRHTASAGLAGPGRQGLGSLFHT